MTPHFERLHSFEITLNHNLGQRREEIDFLICNKSDWCCIVAITRTATGIGSGTRAFVKSIINATKKYTRIIIQIINDPTSNFGEIFFLKVFNQCIDIYIREFSKNCGVDLTTCRITLTLIQNTTPVGEVFVDEFYQDLVIKFNTFCTQDFLEATEELGSDCGFLFSSDGKINTGASLLWRGSMILFL